MRQVVLDTETTGLSPEAQHRIIEIGCVEMEARLYTGRTFHRYLNPERDIDAAAQDVHGISIEQLADKPRFHEIAGEFREFIAGAEVLIHNAPFDVGFLDAEYRRLDPIHGSVAEWCELTDTLALARQRYPGQANSLDALCRRLGVDNRDRDLHGALLDAQLLAEVYLAMTGGQVSLELEAAPRHPGNPGPTAGIRGGRPLPVVEVTAAEREAHQKRLEDIRTRAGICIWDRHG